MEKEDNLSIENQQHIINQIKKLRQDCIDFSKPFDKHKCIEYLKKHLREFLTRRDNGTENRYFIEKLKDEIAILDGSFDRTRLKFTDHSTKQIKGFDSNLTDIQIESLYEGMQGNYFETSPENFEAMLRGKKCYPIDWLHKNNHGEINKTSLVAFIETILKQTKKVSKTHFNTVITSGIKKDMYYDRYVFTFSEMIK